MQILHVAIALIVVAGLLYLVWYDFKHKQVPLGVSGGLIVLLVVLNLLLLVLNGNSAYEFLGLDVVPVDNLVTGAVLAAIVALIIFLTKGKGMGWGDVLLAAIMGLTLGFPWVVIGCYVAIFSALVYGLIYGIKIRKIKGVEIPFVPFIVLGIFVGFFWGNQIWSFFLVDVPNWLSGVLY